MLVQFEKVGSGAEVHEGGATLCAKGEKQQSLKI